MGAAYGCDTQVLLGQQNYCRPLLLLLLLFSHHVIDFLIFVTFSFFILSAIFFLSLHNLVIIIYFYIIIIPPPTHTPIFLEGRPEKQCWMWWIPFVTVEPPSSILLSCQYLPPCGK